MALIAHWKLDETSGTVAYDSESEYNQTLYNFVGTEWTTDRIIGTGALSFTRASLQYTKVSDVPNYGAGASGAFSASIWFKVSALPSNECIIFSRDVWQPGCWALILKAESGGVVYAAFEGISNWHPYYTVNYADGQWHHVVQTWSKTDNRCRLYYDGILRSENTSGSWSGEQAGDILLGVRKDQLGTEQFYFNGILDDARYYGHELTSTEVQNLYNEGFPSSTTTSTTSTTSTSTSTSTTSTTLTTTTLPPTVIVKRVRISGGDYDSWESMVAGVNALFPLTLDLDVYFQGGQTFGQDGALNSEINGSSAEFNGYKLTLRTDPTEVDNTATILGRIKINGGSSTQGYATVMQLKQYINQTDSTSAPVQMPSTMFSGRYEDCVLVDRKTNLSDAVVSGNVVVNNCTIVLTHL